MENLHQLRQMCDQLDEIHEKKCVNKGNKERPDKAKQMAVDGCEKH